MHKTPKSQLHELYQLHGLVDHLASGFQTDAAEDFRVTSPKFVCKLSLPRIGSFGGQVLIGEGQNKKAAEHDASEKALQVLRAAGQLGGQLQPTVTAAPPAGTPAVVSQDQLSELARQLAELLPQSRGEQDGVPQSQQQAPTPAPVDASRLFQAAEAPNAEQSLPVPSSSAAAAAEQVDAMPEEEVRSKLKQALQDLEALKAVLREERARKKFAAEVLLRVGDGDTHYKSISTAAASL